MPFAGILLVILTVAMAVATFVESSHGTNTAWALIYGTWWFELLFFLTAINLVGNILIFKLYKKSKLTVLTFHAAFIIIILGAGITRFLSNEGMMHIREGEVAGTMMGNDTYIDIQLRSGSDEITDSKKIRLSALTPNKFRWSKKINGMPVKIKSVEYIQNAATQFVSGPGGSPYLQLVLFSEQQYTIGLASGEEVSYPGVSVSMDSPNSQSDLRIFSGTSGLFAISVLPVQVSSMGEGSILSYNPGDTILLEQGKLLTLGDVRVVLQRYLPSARLKYVQAENASHGNGMDVVKMEVDVAGMKSELFLPGRSNLAGEPASVKMGDLEIIGTYGSHKFPIPFMLKLNEFQIERYPGSNSPSSFASEVTLIDPEMSIKEDRRIYMNNVLKHRGYRFYQSSYDQDELGTILSVNRDSVGTSITYIGYFFLMLGMFVALFARKNRFARLARRGNEAARAKAILIAALMILGSVSIFAQQLPAPSKEQAKEFGQLWAQGKEGRFKPVNTLSNEIVRKVTGETHLDGLNADQILLGIILYPQEWKSAPLFEVDNPELHMLLGFKGATVSFNDFLPNGKYLLSEFVNNAYNKKVPERTEFDKEVMKLDERVNIMYMVQNGGMLRIFPDLESENNAWVSVSEMFEPGQAITDTIAQVYLAYADALRTGDEALASQIVSFVGKYQEKNCDILPQESRKNAEIYYNKLRLFNRLAPFYALFGIILIIVQFLRIFKPGRLVNYLFKIGIIHLAVAFALHTMALGLRWYIGGHAPLSNGYESMIFVSWISLLAGLIFVKKSGFAISLTAILSALSLLVAHLSWMNPDITNLVPVLKSPWLTIHVTVIMAGYGFLGLSALAGFINLVFYAIQDKNNSSKITPVIDQITTVNHMSIIVGLYFLTAGVFLGGVWANESWGRYWGWDPKETWALISVLVYAFIAHMHNFPGFKGGYAFNLGSLVGYSSILMTYFGVNYFLGGMHSYAGGTTLVIPWYTFAILALIVLLSVFAYRRQKQFSNNYMEEIDES